MLVAIDLVDRKKNRRVTPPQQINRLGICRIDAFLAIEQKNNPVGFCNGQACLFLHPSDEPGRFARIDTAGIHEQKRAALPVHLGEMTVPGDARRIVHNGLAPPLRRLNSVDFPTFGRPTKATTGRRSGEPVRTEMSDLASIQRLFSTRRVFSACQPSYHSEKTTGKGRGPAPRKRSS